MTQMKERAVELIERMPDDNMFYVINILQNIEEMSSNRTTDKKQEMEALQNILKFSGRLPEWFDADRELERAREERRFLLKNLCKIFQISDLNAQKIIAALDNLDFTDFEDGLQEECAVEMMADYIVTRNPVDFKNSRIKVIQPEELLKKI